MLRTVALRRLAAAVPNRREHSFSGLHGTSTVCAMMVSRPKIRTAAISSPSPSSALSAPLISNVFIHITRTLSMRSVPCRPRIMQRRTFTGVGQRVDIGVAHKYPLVHQEGEVEALQRQAKEYELAEAVTLVRTRDEARRAVDLLRSFPKETTVYACDTETTGVDPKVESPVGKGKVVCLSVYCGPDVDFSACGETLMRKDASEKSSCLWIDTMGKEGEAVMQEFKIFLEDVDCKKAWHNYSFDKHVLGNHGVHCMGFAGDTIHMARLWNSSRSVLAGTGSYSLASLSEDLLDTAKTDMKKLFSKAQLRKDGSEGKTRVLQDAKAIQSDPEQFETWVKYSSKDAKVTWWLFKLLETHLRRMEWRPDPSFFATDEEMHEAVKGGMLEFFKRGWRDFGELLTDIEARGILVDKEYLQTQELKATAEAAAANQKFIEWAKRAVCPDAAFMNTASASQKKQLFFGSMNVRFLVNKKYRDPEISVKKNEVMDVAWVFGAQVIKDKEAVFEPSYEGETIENAGIKSFEIKNVEGILEEGRTTPRRTREIKLSSLRLKPTEYTAKGQSSCSGPVVRVLAGRPFDDPPKYGTAMDAFEDKDLGKQACEAFANLAESDRIRTLIDTFLSSLPVLADQNGRIHTSLNIATETGRLSSKMPNLQNQPALEKDTYKIRQAFKASPGNKLIVADYGQLELRIMAHMTNCKSMLEAFELGGDFHSRTAIDMYDNVKAAVDRNEVLLEWDKSKGAAPAPMLKDVYASERRKAKTLNFSIAYGKTKYGLAKDLNITTAEAAETIARWYAARKEVKDWQESARETARRTLHSRTLLGRMRLLTDMQSRSNIRKSSASRAVINTPIQGGAADIVAMGMLKIHRNQELVSLGWKMVLQIHDELILEGPEGTAERAFQVVKECMQNPLARPLRVELPVDGSIADTWYEGK